MRYVLACTIAFVFAFTIKAQNYGNEWINFSQQYFKIPIDREGVYRIDSTTLAAYYDLSSTNPRNFQLFLKGKEQHLYITGEADGKINIHDYVEFYASPFMGDIDSLLYTNIKYMPNPFVPIYSDTLYAFLTLNSLLTNKRFVLETDTASAIYPAEDHFYTEKIFTGFTAYNAVGEYAEGSSDPHLTQAEGKGLNYIPGFVYTTPVSNLNTYTNAPLPFYVTVNYSGNSQSASYNPDHQIQLLYSDQSNSNIILSDSTFYGYAPVRKKFILNSQNTNNSTVFSFSPVAAPSFTNTGYTILHYIHYFYPHTNDLNNASFFKMVIENNSSSPKSFFNFSNFNAGSSGSAILLDLTNGRRIKTVINGTQARAVVPNGLGKKLCILAAEEDTIVVSKLLKVNQTGSFINYKNSAVKKPYVIIYHKNFQAGTQAYKNYRQSQVGGGFDVIDADIETLYEQFSYGIKKHPLSIRNFIKYL